MSLKVLHIVPALNIGGVEVGIYRSHAGLKRQMDYQVFSVKGGGALPVPRLRWQDIVDCVLRRRDTPDVVVSSLWLGHLVGAPLALALRAKWIPFFHVARTEGLLRDTVLRGAARLSRFAFFDCDATRRYYGTHAQSRAQIIPYRFQASASSRQPGVRRRYDCVFVGRLSPQKRPDLLLSYLKHLQQLDAGIRPLILASTDEKRLEQFQVHLQSIGVVADVRANVDPLEVISLLDQSSLYLSFSDYEGFSMATLDAMSCGCVPVVRPVGEIASYVDGHCGVLVTDTSSDGLKAVAKESLRLLKDTEALPAFSERARQSVARYRLYTEAYVDGVQRALGRS
jgi:glycosyltransferase involved in cell wall biosynthesis